MRVLRTIGLTLGAIALIFVVGGFALYQYEHRTIHEVLAGQSYRVSPDKKTLDVEVQVGTSEPSNLSWSICEETPEKIGIKVIDSFRNSTTNYAASAKVKTIHIILPRQYLGQKVVNCNGQVLMAKNRG